GCPPPAPRLGVEAALPQPLASGWRLPSPSPSPRGGGCPPLTPCSEVEGCPPLTPCSEVEGCPPLTPCSEVEGCPPLTPCSEVEGGFSLTPCSEVKRGFSLTPCSEVKGNLSFVLRGEASLTHSVQGGASVRLEEQMENEMGQIELEEVPSLAHNGCAFDESWAALALVGMLEADLMLKLSVINSLSPTTSPEHLQAYELMWRLAPYVNEELVEVVSKPPYSNIDSK
ncbi:hypothetical protein CYMTET_45945, partial [Cymbomonas tetramitiformis]